MKKYDYSFFIMDTAYAKKLFLNESINKFDLLNNGNMGYHGDKRYLKEIKDICSLNSCVFFVEKTKFKKYNQLNIMIYDSIIKKYGMIDSNKYFYVYSNIK